MKSLFQLFSPLQRAASAFFKHDVALRRGERGVHFVLEERSASGARSVKASPEEAVRRKENEELALMRRQLADLLASAPERRSTMRHLVFVEHALAKKGMRAMHKLPLDVMQQALTQLEAAVTNWSPEGLANLRSKMAVALIERERMDPDAEADAYRTSAMMDLDPLEAPAQAEANAGADEQALAAAYAALGNLAPPAADGQGSLEMTGELDSPSAKAALRNMARSTEGPAPIKLRELQS
jgi:hypothetical protein